MKKLFNTGGNMFSDCENGSMLCSDKILDELYNVNTLLKAALVCCQEKEFRGEYYGIPSDYRPMISNERNEYLSLLKIMSEKMDCIKKLNSEF